MSKNWYDFTPEEDELLYSEEFNLMEELGIASTNPDLLEDSPSSSFEELEQLEPQNQQRSKDEDERGMALVMSQLEMAFKAAQTLYAREKDLLQELEDLKKLQERDREQHQEEKLKLLRKTKLIILAHNTQIERKDKTTQELQTELDKVKKENGLLVRQSEELKCTIQFKDGEINQLAEKHEDDKLRILKKTKLIIEAHNTQMERKDRTIQDLQTELDQVKEETGALRDQSDELKNQLQSKDDDIEILQKKVTEIKEMLEKIQEDSCQKSNEWEMEKQAFHKDTADLKSKLQEKSLENTQLMEQYSELERALLNLKSDMSALVQFSNELEVKQKDEAEQKLQMLQQMRDKDAQVQKMEEEKDDILKTCEELKEVLKRSQVERSLLEEQSSVLDQELRNAEVERSLLIKMNNALQQEVERQKQIQTELKEEKTAVSKTCEDLRVERSLQAERCQELEQKLKTTEEQRSLLEEMSRALEQKLQMKKRKWYRRLLRV